MALASGTSEPKSARVGAIGGWALAGVEAGAWVKDMIDIFSTSSTDLQRAAVVTSVVPFLGSTGQAMANEEHGDSKLIDTAACLVVDALCLTPAWPAGLVLSRFQAAVERVFLDEGA